MATFNTTPSLSALDASVTKFHFSVTATVEDFGLNANLNVDTVTLSADTSPPRVRPPEQIKAIFDAYNTANLDVNHVGYQSDLIISLMNQVGVSVGDIVYATSQYPTDVSGTFVGTALTPAQVRAWLMSSTEYAFGDQATVRPSNLSHEDQTLQELGMSSREINVSGHWNLAGVLFDLSLNSTPQRFDPSTDVNTGLWGKYIGFPNHAPYSSKTYTITYHFRRWLYIDTSVSGGKYVYKYYGANKTVTFTKTYTTVVPDSWAAYDQYGYNDSNEFITKFNGSGISVGPANPPGIRNTDYSWVYKISYPQPYVVRTAIPILGAAPRYQWTIEPAGYKIHAPDFKYTVWSSDEDFQVGGERTASGGAYGYIAPTSPFSVGPSVYPTSPVGTNTPVSSTPTYTGGTVTVKASSVSTKANTPTTVTPVSASGTGNHYSISPPLPAGLSFNADTGEITGTAIAGSALTTYTVTITDAGLGTTTKTFTLETTSPDIQAAAGAPVSFSSADPAVGVLTVVTTSTGSISIAYNYTPYFERIATSLEKICTISTTTGIRTVAPFDYTESVYLYNWFTNPANSLSTASIATNDFTKLIKSISTVSQNFPRFL